MYRKTVRKRVGKSSGAKNNKDNQVPAPEEGGKKSAFGVSVFSYVVVTWLLLSETKTFLKPKMSYQFDNDVITDEKIKMFVDITVKTPCDSLAVDLVDATDRSIIKFGKLKMDNTWWELEPAQREQFDWLKGVNEKLKKENRRTQNYHWMLSSPPLAKDLLPREILPKTEKDSCRIHGSMNLIKIAGDFRVLFGKADKAEAAGDDPKDEEAKAEPNFSHRINRFSFGGSKKPNVVQPLEGEEKITSDKSTLYQYYLEIVPTEFKTSQLEGQTFQYSLQKTTRALPYKEKPKTPGIFFNYDMSAFRVSVQEDGNTWVRYVGQIFAAIGGIHVASTLLSRFLQYLVNILVAKFLSKEVVVYGRG